MAVLAIPPKTGRPSPPRHPARKTRCLSDIHNGRVKMRNAFPTNAPRENVNAPLHSHRGQLRVEVRSPLTATGPKAAFNSGPIPPTVEIRHKIELLRKRWRFMLRLL